MTPNLVRLVTRARRRIRLERALAVAGPAAVAAAAVLVVWGLLSRTVVLPELEGVLVPAVVLAALAAVLGATLGRIPAVRAAWTADRLLGSRDAYATAVELLEQAEHPTTGLARQQVVAAEQAAAGVSAFPGRPRPPVRALAVAAGLAALALLLAALPNPQDAERARRAEERAAVAAQAEALREAADELGQEPAAERLREVAEELGTTRPEALAALAEARAELERQLADDLAGRRTALGGLDRELAARPLAPGGTAAEQLQSLAAQAGGGELGAQEQAALAERLEQLAAALQAQPELADALAEAAQGLRAGDPAAASAALAGAAGAATAAAAQLGQEQALAQAAGALGDAAAALQQDPAGEGRGEGTGQGEGEGQGQGAGQGDGQGQGQGAGQGQGTGQGQGQGQGGQGQGGSGGGGGGGMDATGQEQAGRGGGSGTSQDGAGSDAESALDDTTVFDPERAAAAEGDEVRLQGQADPDQPEVEAGRATGPGLRNDGIVPYRDVLGEYADRATRTVQQPGYPVGRRDTVTSYFDRLAQPATP